MAKRNEGQKRAGAAVAVIMALLIFLAAGGVLGWFVHARYGSQNGGEETVSGFTVVTDEETENANAIALSSVKLLTEEFETYGASSQAESAYTVTATVSPVTALNPTLTWQTYFTDASDTWASGKTVSNYVTVTVSEDTLSATVSCLQAFGAQISVLVRASNSSANATCYLEYAQVVTGATLSFGSVSCDFSSGETGVTVALDSSDKPTGGAAEISYTYNTTSVYTVADDSVTNVNLTPSNNFLCRVYTASQYSFSWLSFGELTEFSSSPKESSYDQTAFNSFSALENGLYFGLDWFIENFDLHSNTGYAGVFTSVAGLESSWTLTEILTRYNYALQADQTVSGLGTVYSVSAGSTNVYYYYLANGLNLFDLTLSISGTYTDLSYSTSFVMTDYVGSTVTKIELSDTVVVF